MVLGMRFIELTGAGIVSINTTGVINFFLGTNTATMLDKSTKRDLDDGSDSSHVAHGMGQMLIYTLIM